VDYRIERGTASQAGQLQAIERAAGARFRDVGMADIADGDPTPAEILQDRAETGRLYVALTGERTPVGFLIWSPKDGQAYIEEVTVHVAHAGHRLAARLIDRLAEDVRGRHPTITLTTFRDIPWNAPYYAKLGFAEFPRDQAGPAHALSWQHQAEDGLDMSRRLFMSRPVAS
jgi:GNAT superfamily N-acetyltransferase